MNNENTYNGWRNYATWVCNLWFEEYRLTVFDFYDPDDLGALFAGDDPDRIDEYIYDLSKLLRDEVETWQEQQEQRFGLFADLLGFAVSQIDFYEIAESWIEEAREEVQRNV